ncbi:MAG TPA: histidine phosphatase family protein [Rubrobacter sp.]
MRLYLIRHALTLPTVPDSHLWPLSQEREAPCSRRLLCGRRCLSCTAAPKARRSRRPASTSHGLEIEVDERLREACRPARWIEDYEGAVRRYLEHPGGPPEEWESAPDVRARMVECIAEISTCHPGKTVAVCGHGLALASFYGNAFDLWHSTGFAQVAVVEGGKQTAPVADPVDDRWR